MLAHRFSHRAPGMSAGAHTSTEHAHTLLLGKTHTLLLGKTDYLPSQSSEAQIMCTRRTHTNTPCQERGVENRQQKGPKRPDTQPEGLLAFLLQGEKEQKKRAERLVDSVL